MQLGWSKIFNYFKMQSSVILQLSLKWYFWWLFQLICEEDNGTPLQYSCLENPWTEEPGGLQSMGSLRVGND